MLVLKGRKRSALGSCQINFGRLQSHRFPDVAVLKADTHRHAFMQCQVQRGMAGIDVLVASSGRLATLCTHAVLRCLSGHTVLDLDIADSGRGESSQRPRRQQCDR